VRTNSKGSAVSSVPDPAAILAANNTSSTTPSLRVPPPILPLLRALPVLNLRESVADFVFTRFDGPPEFVIPSRELALSEAEGRDLCCFTFLTALTALTVLTPPLLAESSLIKVNQASYFFPGTMNSQAIDHEVFSALQ